MQRCRRTHCRRLTPCPVPQEGEDRDVQDQLVELLQYDNFPLIKQLLRNRITIVWCQKLARAQNDAERSRIEVRARSTAIHTRLSGFLLRGSGPPCELPSAHRPQPAEGRPRGPPSSQHMCPSCRPAVVLGSTHLVAHQGGRAAARALQAEMAGVPDTAAILDALNPTRTTARARQDQTARRIREEATRLAGPGGAAGVHGWHTCPARCWPARSAGRTCLPGPRRGVGGPMP